MKRYSDILNDSRIILINKRLSEQELDNILNLTDYGICPYTRATTPATLLDFISYSLPIITSDDPNVLNLIQNYPALISERGKFLQLAHKITYAYKNLPEFQNKVKNFENMDSFINAWDASVNSTVDCYFNIFLDNS